MPRGHKSKLRAREKRRQHRAEAQSPKSAQAIAGEEGEAPCSSSSLLGDPPSSATGAGPLQAPSSAPATTSVAAGVSCERAAGKAKGCARKSKNPSRASPPPESCGLDILTQKACKLVEYLLCQYQLKEPIKKADMLKIVRKWYRKDFSEIVSKASEHMDLVHGLELKEVKPSGNSYTLVDSSDESLSRVWRFPIRGILMPLLGVIFLNGNRASEEEMWEFLNMMGIYDGMYHFIFGEPRQLITQELVQEQYLVYRRVPDTDSLCYEFLWGPRTHAETSKMKILEFIAKLNEKAITDFPHHYEEALRDEEERSQARAQAEAGAGCHSEASGHLTATSCCYPHSE
ncbi:melanoma-associated antigen B2-like [Pteronotus mesoamericanus]|uniref:melanoma-associated antigen B2-like n=1 Tax=Pteronotus mesoamericanus TaxID=1884717 RepID=UPI0023EBE51A|nr:melanoma-associated antigen B2-like [Pteronotus parnellii mesoamericanus]